MSPELKKYLKETSVAICKKFAENELDSMLDKGVISPWEKDDILEKLDFNSFTMMIEAIYYNLDEADSIKTKGDLIAAEFTVKFEVDDALEQWKYENILPEIEDI